MRKTVRLAVHRRESGLHRGRSRLEARGPAGHGRDRRRARTSQGQATGLDGDGASARWEVVVWWVPYIGAPTSGRTGDPSYGPPAVNVLDHREVGTCKAHITDKIN